MPHCSRYALAKVMIRVMSIPKPYSQSFAKSSRSHYIALEKWLPAAVNEAMGLDDSFKRRLARLIQENDLSVNALGEACKLPESTIRAILQKREHSAKLSTVERLAKGLNVSAGDLLGIKSEPVNRALLAGILESLLSDFFPDKRTPMRVAQAVLRAYAVGIETGVNPGDPLDLTKITRSESDRLLDEVHPPKSAK